MRPNDKTIIPTGYEFICVCLTALVLLIVGNAQVFLEHYGLISSSAVLGAQVGGTITTSLSILDSFSITPTLVTFITWGIIGLSVFSIAQAFARASGTFKFERDLSSNRYIHPQNFNRQMYWKHVITDTIVSFVLIALLVVGAAMYVLFVVPVGFSYTQQFILHPSIGQLLSLGLGVFTIWSGTVLLYLLLKLVVWRHRISLGS